MIAFIQYAGITEFMQVLSPSNRRRGRLSSAMSKQALIQCPHSYTRKSAEIHCVLNHG